MATSRAGRKIALVVCGSIAAYKAALVARRLVADGLSVVPLMTSSARHFIGPLTLSGICGAPVVETMFDASYAGELHVDIARSVDLVLVVPATADFLARLASGRADDVASALALTAECPVLVAPAMHSRMWSHPATVRNVATLSADGRVAFVGPVLGALASGEIGMGRLAEPDAIADAALAALGLGDLDGVRIVVTAGPTVEDIDPVRFLGNRSTGRMGFAVAERAALRGARVTLIAGPVALETPRGAVRVDVRGAREMKHALEVALGPNFAAADALVMSAAVADYAPREASQTKIKKGAGPLVLELEQNPDILGGIGAARVGGAPVLVGFAVETAEAGALVDYARSKLAAKRVDMVVANHADDGFGKDTNRATLVTAEGTEPLALMSKLELADVILDRVRSLCVGRGVLSC